MTRRLAALVLGSAPALALSAATQTPSVLAQAQPGLWEVSGVPGAAALRQCVADVALLARFEQREKSCKEHTIHEAGTLTVIDYSCGPAGFGHSEVTLLTPRSLRVATQGISQGLPFNYVFQAHRIGDCAAAQRH